MSAAALAAHASVESRPGGLLKLGFEILKDLFVTATSTRRGTCRYITHKCGVHTPQTPQTPAISTACAA